MIIKYLMLTTAAIAALRGDHATANLALITCPDTVACNSTGCEMAPPMGDYMRYESGPGNSTFNTSLGFFAGFSSNVSDGTASSCKYKSNGIFSSFRSIYSYLFPDLSNSNWKLYSEELPGIAECDSNQPSDCPYILNP